MSNTLRSRRGLRMSAAAAVMPLLALVHPGAARAEAAPLIWTFDKCATAYGVWEGTASIDGTTESLRTQLTGLRASGQVLHVTFDWQVGDTFLAPLSGTLNQATGAVVMSGVATQGAYAGSQVHEQGQLYDPARSCFAGTIRLMPATS